MALNIAFAQDFEKFSSYKNWGITLGGAVDFNAGVTSSNSILKSKAGLGYDVGLFYNMFQAKRWGANIGLNLNIRDSYRFKLSGTNNFNNTYSDQVYYLSIPIMATFKHKLYENAFLNAKFGLDVLLTGNNKDADFTKQTINGGITKESFSFDSRVHSSNMNASMLFSVGGLFTLKNFLLGANVVCSYPLDGGTYRTKGNYTFQDASTVIFGNYNFRGGYIGLSLSLQFKKSSK